MVFNEKPSRTLHLRTSASRLVALATRTTETADWSPGDRDRLLVAGGGSVWNSRLGRFRSARCKGGGRPRPASDTKAIIQTKLTRLPVLAACDSAEPIRYNSRFAFTNEAAMTKVARKFLIRGNVQGVGYRFFAQRAAARHQVVGYVRNCSDGTVEALAEGPAPDVEEFKIDLAAGPQWASVENVEEISVDPSGTYSAFRIER